MNKRPRKSSRAVPADARPLPQLRGRLGIDIGTRTALTEAGADLLEQIAVSGSLSQAARQLHLSYRWAWLLVDAMNRAWQKPLVLTATGGKCGGGATLTPLGRSVLSAYRHLQLELEHFLDLQSRPFRRAVKTL